MAKVKLLGIKADGFQLTVDGEPFFIKGAGLKFGHLKSLAEAGRMPLEPGAWLTVSVMRSIFYMKQRHSAQGFAWDSTSRANGMDLITQIRPQSSLKMRQ